MPKYGDVVITTEVIIDKALAIDGWMTYEELTWLAQTARECEVIIEIGSYKGRSARALADNCIGRVYCIDPWNEITYDDNDSSSISIIKANVFDEFRENLKDHIELGRVIPLKQHANEVKFNSCADLVFIDGDHRYPSIMGDIKRAKEWIKSGGIIAGHDYNQQGCPSVKRAVDEVFPEFQLVGTIWWTQKL